jgi:ABC-type uncharacterized transport system auxiliary subunit
MALLKLVAIAMVLALLAGCASLDSPADDYQLGDGVAHYCESTDKKVRASGRLLAHRAGVTLPDLCAARELIGGEVPVYGKEI